MDKLKILKYLVIIVVVGFILIQGASYAWEKILEANPMMIPPEQPDTEFTIAGVVVHGYNAPGWIKNTNDFPVYVERYRWHGHRFAEYRHNETVWEGRLNPGQKKEFPLMLWYVRVSEINGNRLGAERIVPNL